MSSVDGYRDGVTRMAESLQEAYETSKKNVEEHRKEKKTELSLNSVNDGPSPGYVVEWSALKRNAQTLIDSGEYSGEQLETLKKFIAGPEKPPTPD